MIDISRIDSALDALRTAWLRDPEQRLGQLVVNGAAIGSGRPAACPEVFYLEDADLLRGLDALNPESAQ